MATKLGQLGLPNRIRLSDLKSDNVIGRQLNDSLDSDNNIDFYFKTILIKMMISIKIGLFQ